MTLTCNLFLKDPQGLHENIQNDPSDLNFGGILHRFLEGFRDVLEGCFFVLHIVTPFPAASPSALTTIGNFELFKYSTTCFLFLHIRNLAVGILFSLHICRN